MKKVTVIAGAVMSAIMFASIAVGATLALYTSEKTVNVHLYSGNLSAELYLTKMQRDEIGDDGQWIIDNEVDLSSYGAAYDQEKGVDLSVYEGEIFSDLKLVPGMSGTAYFRLYNTGDINFNYGVSRTNDTGGAELKDDMIITLPTSTTLVAKGAYSDFTVKYEFRDDGVDEHGVGKNNDAMNQTISFDISVLCTQIQKA